MANNEFPRFIQNRPNGLDKFEGASQTKLAKAIAQQIVNNDALPKEVALPKIIGIQGEWGAGKTNVVRLLEKELSGKYYFFEYDAWGHQEDLQRRSILELLTDKLIEDGFLEGMTTIKVKGGGKKSVSWPDKLKLLLARKTETVTEKYPKINNGMAAAALVAILTPIFTYIAYTIRPICSGFWLSFLSILISALPVIVGLSVWGCAYRKNHKYGLSYLLAIYNDKIENDICYETLSEEEPTVTEFKAWMGDISDYIGKEKKPRLVLVFDNMDRLPAGKVKELWSSIHTFFADDGFENIWAIIPFDKKHLACAFGNEGSPEATELTKLFINKTFPIVYRVAPPVITDYRIIFDKLFVEAFGNTADDSKESINRLFRMVKADANVRETIMFINALVALKQERGNDVSLINMAVYLLFQDEILDNPIKQILSGEYLEKIKSIIDNDILMQREISALVYGVDVKLASQIPLTKYIENCIAGNEGYDINIYSESNISFDTVLEEVALNRDDIPVDNIINCLGSLDKDNAQIQKIWRKVAQKKLQLPLNEQDFTKEYQILLSKIKDLSFINNIVNTFYQKIYNHTEIKGDKYYISLSKLEAFLRNNNISCQLTIQNKTVTPEFFVDYLRAANEQYGKYQVITDSDALDIYLSEKLNSDGFSCSDIIAIINEDTHYKFPKLLNEIEECVEKNDIDELNVGEVFSIYKTLSKDTPLKKSLAPQTIASIIQKIDPKQNGYTDVVAMRLVQGQQVPSVDKSYIPDIAENIDYYAKYDELLINNISWGDPLLNSVLKYMVQHGLGEHLSIESILPHYFQIRDKIGVTDEELINHLSGWSDFVDGAITKENIHSIIKDASFYELSVRYKNSLTDKINIIAVEAISMIKADDLYAQRNAHATNYWHKAINALAGTGYMHPQPENVSDFAKKILSDVGKNEQSLPLPDEFSKIIDFLDNSNIYSTISDVRNDICNGKMNITVERFKFFEKWFRTQGRLEDRASDAVDKILKPIINNEECQALLIENQDYYISLINSAGDASNDFKQALKNIVNVKDNPNLKQFALSVGVRFESTKEKE